MSPFSEAIQISIISVGIVFTTLLVFSFLIQFMGNYFQRINKQSIQSVSQREAPLMGESLVDKKKIAAIMTVFQEEYGDKLAEIQISRVNGKESKK